MEQSIIECFNQATSFAVGCKTRIKNIVANASLAKVSMIDTPVVTFSTIRKGKITQSVTYSISREHLTEQQLETLTVASLSKSKE